MIILSEYVIEGTSLEAKPTKEQGALHGMIFKELDTGESYIFRNRSWQYINLGLSFIKATKSGRITTDASGSYTVAFTTPFIDANYTVALSCEDDPGPPPRPIIATFHSIAISGFSIKTRDARSGATVGGRVVSWLATRDYNP